MKEAFSHGCKSAEAALILAVVWLAVAVAPLAMGRAKATENWIILAARNYQGWMDDIRDYKLEAGLSLTPYDALTDRNDRR